MKKQFGTGKNLKLRLLNIEVQEDEAVNDNAYEDFTVRGTRSLADIYQGCNIAVIEPASVDDAIQSSYWKRATQDELGMIEKNETWELVDRPSHKNVIGVKWIFRTKLNADGSVNKLKARLVVKGYAQQYGIDFF